MNNNRIIADRISTQLMDDLKSKKIEKIDISIIKDAIRKDPNCPEDFNTLRDLETLTTRLVVNKTV